MPASAALVLERLLDSEKVAKRPGGLVTQLGARICRASELASPRDRAALPTAAPSLDRLLPGGLPKGSLLELTGRRSSGRFSLVFSALAAVTSTGRPAALVDLGDHLDPQAAEDAGIDLTRLLWARPRRTKEALAAAEMLVAAGFPLVVADLGLAPRTRYLPDAAWVRLARAAAAQGASLLLSTPWRASGIAAEAVVSAGDARGDWQGGGGAPRLLAGLSTRLTLDKLGRTTPGTRAAAAFRAAEALSGAAPPGSRSSAYEAIRETPGKPSKPVSKLMSRSIP
jgi:hypothetical protein